MPYGYVLRQHQVDALKFNLLDLADARPAYETDATFRAQVDLFVTGLPAMVRAIAEEVPGRQAAIQAAIDLARVNPITADKAMRLISETAGTLIDRAEQADRRPCKAHGNVDCPCQAEH
jgi:hypothetical protein